MDDKILAVVDGRACYIRESEDGGKIEMLPDEPPEITKGIKYSSRSEALAHIEKGIEPESMLVPRLQERVRAAEERAAAAKYWNE